MSENIQRGIVWAVLASEAGHIFCCVLPAVFSLATLAAGAGMLIMPPAVAAMHDALHDWEIPMMAFSGTILVAGWVLYIISRQLDCRASAGCAHTPCQPRKRMTGRIMMVATALFVLNVTIYAVFHRDYAPGQHAHQQAHSGKPGEIPQ